VKAALAVCSQEWILDSGRDRGPGAFEAPGRHERIHAVCGSEGLGGAAQDGTKLFVKRVIEPLGAFEPRGLREQVLHQEALRQLNNLIELRRRRFESVSSGMAGSLWSLVLIGAALNLMLCWLLRTGHIALHASLIGILSVLMGLLIFMMAAMDHPFRGEMSIGPDAFQLVYDEVMGGG
jgi:hypothetical protein